MSSSLLFEQCPACLVRLILIVFVMGGRWPYSCFFVGCCLRDLFKIARSVNVQTHTHTHKQRKKTYHLGHLSRIVPKPTQSTHTHTHTHTHTLSLSLSLSLSLYWHGRLRLRQWSGRPGFNPGQVIPKT